MSAIRMTCPDCGTVFFAGMVGNWPWPVHVCPTESALQRTTPLSERIAEELSHFPYDENRYRPAGCLPVTQEGDDAA